MKEDDGEQKMIFKQKKCIVEGWMFGWCERDIHILCNRWLWSVYIGIDKFSVFSGLKNIKVVKIDTFFADKIFIVV